MSSAGRVAVAQHVVVAGQDARGARCRGCAPGSGGRSGASVERRALVAELVVGLGLVHVVRAARVGVVVDRDEQVGVERVREPRCARRGRRAASCRPGSRKSRSSVRVRSTSAPAPSSRPRRWSATPRLTSASVSPLTPIEPREDAAVAGIEHDAAAARARVASTASRSSTRRVVAGLRRAVAAGGRRGTARPAGRRLRRPDARPCASSARTRARARAARLARRAAARREPDSCARTLASRSARRQPPERRDASCARMPSGPRARVLPRPRLELASTQGRTARPHRTRSDASQRAHLSRPVLEGGGHDVRAIRRPRLVLAAGARARVAGCGGSRHRGDRDRRVRLADRRRRRRSASRPRTASSSRSTS